MHEFLVNLDRIACDYNAKIHYRDDFGNPWEKDSLDGVVVSHHSRYHIGINTNLWEYEKTSVSLHEVGHIATDTVWVVGSLICERMADAWMIDHIIPTDKLYEAIEFYGEDWDWYNALFWVSHEIMEKKCSKFLRKC